MPITRRLRKESEWMRVMRAFGTGRKSCNYSLIAIYYMRIGTRSVFICVLGECVVCLKRNYPGRVRAHACGVRVYVCSLGARPGCSAKVAVVFSSQQIYWLVPREVRGHWLMTRAHSLRVWPRAESWELVSLSLSLAPPCICVYSSIK